MGKICSETIKGPPPLQISFILSSLPTMQTTALKPFYFTSACLWFRRKSHSLLLVTYQQFASDTTDSLLLSHLQNTFWYQWHHPQLVQIRSHGSLSISHCQGHWIWSCQARISCPTGISSGSWTLNIVSLADIIKCHHLSHHFYVNDSQLQNSDTPEILPSLLINMCNCFNDIQKLDGLHSTVSSLAANPTFSKRGIFFTSINTFLQVLHLYIATPFPFCYFVLPHVICVIISMHKTSRKAHLFVLLSMI